MYEEYKKVFVMNDMRMKAKTITVKQITLKGVKCYQNCKRSVENEVHHDTITIGSVL